MRDLRQTPEYDRYMEMLGWQVIKVNNESGIKNNVFIKKLPLLGNIGKLQRPQGKLDLGRLDEFAKKHALAALYIEPSLNTRHKILDTQYKIHKTCFLPSKTIQIDLSQSEKELFNQIKKDTRYSLRKAKEAGIKVIKSEDIQTFIKMWQAAARRRGMWLPQRREINALWNAFQNKAGILFAYEPQNSNPVVRSDTPVYQKNPIAGVLIVKSPDTAYYMYAFSTKEGNKFSAPTLLAWVALKIAKSQGSKVFDFEGIYDERYPQTKNWKGFTKFKEGFGGKIITYPRTLVRYYNPIARFFL